jgi:AcrR family transcriptional regulator
LPHLRSERVTPLDAWRDDLLEAGGRAESAMGASDKLKPGPGTPAAVVAVHQRRRIREGLLELVAEDGYARLTVRKLATRAGVSTRSVYQHYPNKEACLMSAHQAVVRRVLRSVEAAGLEAGSAEQRLALAVEAIVSEWASDPRAARLMLLDAYSAGASSLKQARLASRSLEARIGECLDYGPEGGGLEPLAAEAVIAGVSSAARHCLLNDEAGLGDLRRPLGRWAAAYHELPDWRTAGLAHRGSLGFDQKASSGAGKKGGIVGPDGDRGLLLAATSKLVVARGNADLDLEDIASVAGISRRGFETEFESPEACVAATHSLCARRALERAVRSGEALVSLVSVLGEPRATFISLASQLAINPALGALCFSDVAMSGPELVRSHQDFLTRIAFLVAGSKAPGPAAEASAGALWGPLHQRVVTGRATRAVEVVPALVAFALQPFPATNPIFTS